MLRITLFTIITILYLIAFILFIRPSQKPFSQPKSYDGPLDTSRAVIHHTAGSKESDKDLSVEEIDRIHKERGWDGCGYHFVIRKDGTVEDGRPLSKLGAHAKGRNNYIGIALTGYDNFTVQQMNSLIVLLTDLDVKQIEKHHEECPGPGVDLEHIQIILDSLNVN